MASEELIRFVLFYFGIPFFTWIGIIIALAAFGKSFGVRRLYIKILLFIFEWGKKRIKIHEETHGVDHNVSEQPDVQTVGSSFSAIEEVSDEAEAAETESTSSSTTQLETGDDKHEQPTTSEATYNTADKQLSNGDTKESGHLIQRELKMSSARKPRVRRLFSITEDSYHEFKMADIMYFCKSGIEAIVEDEVTQRFSAEELNSWNLLTRTNTKLEFISVRLTLLWFAGWVLRYIILFPFRLMLAVYAIGLLIVGTAFIGSIPDPKRRRWWYVRLNLMCYRVMGRAFSAIVNFHNKENRAKGGGICVANHTSPIDIIILSADNTYAMVGQSQPGFIGIIQRAMSRAEAHVWFERAESKDRMAVANRLREHVEDTNKLPILIFPEGTCINNTSIMMFKKGSFEVGGVIYPVAIKYDPRFADAFWNSSEQGFVKHMLMIMTSWALVCDVWYLPPEHQRPGENAVQFANRVKANIAAQGGLVDLEWDGGLKRSQPKSSMMQKQQEEYSKKLGLKNE